jgi:hypothetical protein
VTTDDEEAVQLMVRPTAAKLGARFTVVCAVALAAAATAGATTGPGAVAKVPVVLTATKVVIPKDKFVLPSQPEVARFPRGAEINFGIKNTGGKPAVLVLRLTSKLHFVGASGLKKLAATPPIAPGKTKHMRAQFFFRASFEFQELVGGKVVARHKMVIF